MAKIYLSATYSDLKEFRDAVYDVLRMLRHDVIAMEDYVATDAYPLHKCLADVAACDIYIGLVGWRYGYIPNRDNLEQKSITELEYLQAGKANLPRLMFLADKEASWPDEYNDAKTGEGDKGQRIAAFRRELETAKLVSYFRTPEQLAKLVSVAVQLCVAEGLRKAPSFAAPPGPVRIELCRRLGEDWEDLAVYFDIPMDRRRRFTPGRECHGILAWLEERTSLDRLAEGFIGIGRDDLVALLSQKR